jgi:hypothetical protein
MMQHLRPTLVIGLLLTLTGLAGQAQDKEKPRSQPAPNYYPLEAGNEWQYRLTANQKTISTTARIAKVETIDGVALARLETNVGGKTAASEHLQQTDKGVFRHRFNGVQSIPPFLLLKYPAKSGIRWSGEFKNGVEMAKYTCHMDEETVEVPAGEFKAIKVVADVDTGQLQLRTTYWFAQDVGIVKQTADAGNLEILMELEKYDVKKPRRREVKER